MRNDGGPAFGGYVRNRKIVAGQEYFEDVPAMGMSLRDYFAAAALQGMCSTMDRDLINEIGTGTIGGRFYVQASFVLADAMLAEREKP